MTIQEFYSADRQLRKLLTFAQTQKRMHGDPHNPTQGAPGHEAEFQKYDEECRNIRVALNEFEKSSVRQSCKVTLEFATDATERTVYLFILLGWVLGAVVGFVVFCMAFGWNTMLLYAIIVLVALAAEIGSRWRKRRKRQK